ncbi:lytic murein transglycosylase [Donghicola mangrovi]|uniref:Lytic murein transglycosylase n=1 Tax=Donghicola mangrovi TaxID=2729614 RepID=A0A850Q978_9RHOB|nr:lytic murein transglycosylase [Donghicola mangrovi]
MRFDRRHFLGAVMLTGVAACSGGPQSYGPVAGAAAEGMTPVRNPAYDAWMQGFYARAEGAGYSRSFLNRAFAGTGYLPGVVERDRNQTEFSRSLEDYLSIAVSDERVAKGRAAFARHRGTLMALEQRYGVDAQIIAAIWGLESFYGERRGDIPVLSATTTLAFDGRRGVMFEKQTMAALRILQEGHVSPDRFTGSWAGAMGHTQFMPTSFQAFAVDFTGDGRADIWADDPTDALASTAAYLSRNGWQRGLRWGREAPSGSGGLQPQAGGPSFETTANFRVIKRYNNSDSYALGVGLLSDRIMGGGPLRGSFPPDAYGLTKSDRIALQRSLNASGYDVGTPDGVFGTKTRTAIEAFQRRAGLPVTGEPSVELLRMLG